MCLGWYVTVPAGTKQPTGQDWGYGEIVVSESALLPVYATTNIQYESLGVFADIIRCLIREESGGDVDAKGDLDHISGPSYGILQFQYPTFREFSEKYGMVLDYKNPQHQILLAERMLLNGHGERWTTYKKCV